jgi:hypothetical protein
MAITVAAAFNELAIWLRTTPRESEAARRHRASLSGRLATEFGVRTFFPTGSFGAGTNVPRYSDVDYFAVMPTASFEDSSAGWLAAIAADLRVRFPRTRNIRVDSPGVAVPFGVDRSEHTEIVPVIEDGLTREGFRSFWMPDGDGDWMFTSPGAHNTWVGQVNTNQEGRVKPLIRMLKAWKYYRSVPIRSFYLEVFAAIYASQEPSIEYAIDLQRMFARLNRSGLRPIADPLFPRLRIEATKTENQRLDAMNKLGWAVEWSSLAIEYAQNRQTREAFDRWDTLFYGGFPRFTGIRWI